MQAAVSLFIRLQHLCEQDYTSIKHELGSKQPNYPYHFEGGVGLRVQLHAALVQLLIHGIGPSPDHTTPVLQIHRKTFILLRRFPVEGIQQATFPHYVHNVSSLLCLILKCAASTWCKATLAADA